MIIRASTFGDGLPDCPNDKNGILRQAPQGLNNSRNKIHPSNTAIRQMGSQLALHTHIQGMARSGHSCIEGEILEG